MKKLVPLLFAVAGVGFLVPSVKSLVRGEPTEAAFLVIGLALITLSIVFGALGRRTAGRGSGARNN